MKLGFIIFDGDGNELKVENVIQRYLFELSVKHKKEVEDISIGIELSHPIRLDGKNKLCVYDDDFNCINSTLCNSF